VLYPRTIQAEEKLIPTAILPIKYKSVWENSPFNREVIEAVETVVEDSKNKSLVLEGLIEDDQVGHIAYVRDLATETLMVITSRKSEEHDLVIVSANYTADPGKAKITVYDGKKSSEVAFASTTLTAPISAPSITSESRDPKKGKSDTGSLVNRRTAPGQPAAPRTGSTGTAPSRPGNGTAESISPDPNQPDSPPIDAAAKNERARKLRILPPR